MDAKPYYCKHCKNPLGVTSEKSLSLGSVKIAQPVKLQCVLCGRMVTWRPELKIRIQIPVYPV